jgi:hypothetical protein
VVAALTAETGVDASQYAYCVAYYRKEYVNAMRKEERAKRAKEQAKEHAKLARRAKLSSSVMKKVTKQPSMSIGR